MSSGDVELLRYRHLAEYSSGFRQTAHSEADNSVVGARASRLDLSMLKLSKTRISVNDSVTVYWDIKESCGPNDWIGLYDLGEFERL